MNNSSNTKNPQKGKTKYTSKWPKRPKKMTKQISMWQKNKTAKVTTGLILCWLSATGHGAHT